MTTLSQQIDELGAKQLRELWGGRMPTWEEFKQANKDGRVRVNKSLANKLALSRGMPKAHRIVFGIITLWTAFLAPPVAILLYFFLSISAWWIAGSIGLTWYLIKVSRDGQCDGLRYGAENDEQFYQALINNGAFLFGPKPNTSAKPQ